MFGQICAALRFLVLTVAYAAVRIRNPSAVAVSSSLVFACIRNVFMCLDTNTVNKLYKLTSELT